MIVIKFIRTVKINQVEIAKALGVTSVSLMHDLSESEILMINKFITQRTSAKLEFLAQISEIKAKIELLKSSIPSNAPKSHSKYIRNEIKILNFEKAKLHNKVFPAKNRTLVKGGPKEKKEKWARIILTPMS